MAGLVYMLHCADGSYYIGVASGHDLAKRVAEHEMGVYGGYTSTRRPVQLVWSQYFERIEDAIAAERKLKGWSRAKKAALIDSNWPRIAALAKRRGGRPRSQKPDPSP